MVEINIETDSLVLEIGITSSTLNFIRRQEYISYLDKTYDYQENKYRFTVIYTGDDLKELIVTEPMVRINFKITQPILTDKLIENIQADVRKALIEGYKVKEEIEAKHGPPPPLLDPPINWNLIRNQQIEYFMGQLSKFRIVENFVLEKMLHPFLKPTTEILNWELIKTTEIASEDEKQNEQFDKYK